MRISSTSCRRSHRRDFEPEDKHMKKPGRFILLAALAVLPAAAMAADSDQVSAAKQTVVDYNAARATRDAGRYASLCTDDYLIAEDGHITDLKQDLEYLRSHPWHDGKSRVDVRKVLIRGDNAYVIYFLDFEFAKAQSVEHHRFFETAVLRRTARGWRVFLVHSTQLADPA
jgi:ketosteroid isomerase-like protein